MLHEGARPISLYEVDSSKGKSAEKNRVENRRAFSFEEAINQTLLGDVETIDQSRLTPYERELIGKENVQINLLIDVDGVLIDTEQEIKALATLLTQDWNIIDNIVAVKEKIQGSKIPFGIRRLLLACRKKVENVILVTDRLGKGPCYFPCLGEDKKHVLKKHGISVHTDSFKALSAATEFTGLIDAADITYYIGSSGTDDKYVSKMRANIEKKHGSSEKLLYIKVNIYGKQSIL